MSSNLHPDSRLKSNDTTCNDSNNTAITDIIGQCTLTRREFLKSSASATAGITAMTVFGQQWSAAWQTLPKRRHHRLRQSVLIR